MDHDEAGRDVRQALHVGERPVGVEDPGDQVRRELPAHLRRLVRLEVLVEAPEVGADALVADRRAGGDQARSLDDPAVRTRVAVDHDRLVHAAEQLDLLGVEPLHQPVVEEADPAVRR